MNTFWKIFVSMLLVLGSLHAYAYGLAHNEINLVGTLLMGSYAIFVILISKEPK